MIFVIMNYGVNRNQAGRTWWMKALIFAIGATLAAALTGAVVGLIGLAIPESAHQPFVVAAAAGAALIGTLQLTSRLRRVPQRNCETGQLWMNTGALTGAFLNGAALGTGFLTRVGYWLWYALPLAVLLAGPARGAIIFGFYGLVRGAAPGLAITQMVLRRSCEHKDITRVQEWLINRSRLARLTAGTELVALATFAATVVMR